MVSSTPWPHFTPGKDPVPILQEAGLTAPGPVWAGGKTRPHQDSIPDRSARSSVAIPTELPDPPTHTHTHTHTHIYIYKEYFIYRKSRYPCVCVYIYIYIYIYSAFVGLDNKPTQFIHLKVGHDFLYHILCSSLLIVPRYSGIVGHDIKLNAFRWGQLRI